MASATAAAHARPQRLRLTMRQDRWWGPPLFQFLTLSALISYSLWAAYQGNHYAWGNYLSPMYSPELFGTTHHAWFGPPPSWWPENDILPFSPAWLALGAPVGFRLTCYYYRGTYYKAFWADPPACAVGEPRKVYLGENSFPLIVQNLHRYFLYLALLYLFVLAHDAYKAMWFLDPKTGTEHFGIGVGTLVLTANVACIASYTFGCHSLRHLVGGGRDTLSAHGMSLACYNCAGKFNRWHMNWAWTSLVVVSFSDLYVRLCSMGIWTDFRIL